MFIGVGSVRGQFVVFLCVKGWVLCSTVGARFHLLQQVP